ncbi:hypothetical protein DPMN_133285 [Dreissena polymorpha]|uniref:Uncharacterized protein n=1 Tax=Dreissena polymorpha TaxID=45954 RepID=A0A9D4JDV2_DREPO|nr:hypothetical protein DPMN_133285 [Dreissena polymorpha]
MDRTFDNADYDSLIVFRQLDTRTKYDRQLDTRTKYNRYHLGHAMSDGPTVQKLDQPLDLQFGYRDMRL